MKKIEYKALSRNVCYAYLKSTCERGDKCRFSHHNIDFSKYTDEKWFLFNNNINNNNKMNNNFLFKLFNLSIGNCLFETRRETKLFLIVWLLYFSIIILFISISNYYIF